MHVFHTAKASRCVWVCDAAGRGADPNQAVAYLPSPTLAKVLWDMSYNPLENDIMPAVWNICMSANQTQLERSRASLPLQPGAAKFQFSQPQRWFDPDHFLLAKRTHLSASASSGTPDNVFRQQADRSGRGWGSEKLSVPNFRTEALFDGSGNITAIECLNYILQWSSGGAVTLINSLAGADQGLIAAKSVSAWLGLQPQAVSDDVLLHHYRTFVLNWTATTAPNAYLFNTSQASPGDAGK